MEIFAAIFGILGSYVIGNKGASARWGWPLFLLSNIGWLWYGLHIKNYALLVQTGFFTFTSLRGIKNTFYDNERAISP